jgi:hypothetical protein
MSLPAGTYGLAEASFRDAGNEIGKMKLYGATLSAGDFAAQQTAWGALMTAVNALVLGVETRRVYGNEVLYSTTQPTNGAAREIKLLVQAQDDTNGQRMYVTIPTIDPTIPSYVENINAKDVVRVDTPAAITDFISAFEAFAVNPRTGNGLLVVGLKVVGRST